MLQRIETPLIFCILLLFSVITKTASFAVVGYLPEWRYEGSNFETMCSGLTHLIFFSLEPTPIGDITGFDRLPGSHVLSDAKLASQKYGCKLMICFGGNGRSNGFSDMVRNKESRVKFVKKVKALIHDYEFDGIDYNWEYPGYHFQTGYARDDEIQKDYIGLVALLKNTRKSIGKDKIITLAYYPDGRQEKLLHDGKAEQYVDLMHMMSYDQNGGHHSTYDLGVKSVQLGISSGLPPSKLTMGLPFYGRNSITGDWITYEDIVQKYHPLQDSLDQLQVPTTRGSKNSFIGYNGIDTIKRKVQYSLESNIGGVMIWEAGQDCRRAAVHRSGKVHAVTCPRGDDSSLLVAISRMLGNYSVTVGKSESSQEL